MRKSKILKVIRDQLEESNRLNDSVLEMIFTPLYDGGKRRLAYCVLDDDQWDDIQALVNNSINGHYGCDFTFRNNIDEAIANVEEDDSIVLENNWRGRLFHEEHLIGRNEDDARDFLLNSYWRIIVNRNGRSYFVRTDIYPFFWSPGHSTGESEDYKESVKNYLEQYRINKSSRIDAQFDFIKVFAKHEGVNAFTPMNFSPIGDNDIVAKVDLNELRMNFDTKVANILNHLRNYFGN